MGSPGAITTPDSVLPKRFVSANNPNEAIASMEAHTAKCHSDEISEVLKPSHIENVLWLNQHNDWFAEEIDHE